MLLLHIVLGCTVMANAPPDVIRCKDCSSHCSNTLPLPLRSAGDRSDFTLDFSHISPRILAIFLPRITGAFLSYFSAIVCLPQICWTSQCLVGQVQILTNVKRDLRRVDHFKFPKFNLLHACSASFLPRLAWRARRGRVCWRSTAWWSASSAPSPERLILLLVIPFSWSKGFLQSILRLIILIESNT